MADRDAAIATAFVLDAYLPLLTTQSVAEIENLIAVLEREDAVLPITNPSQWRKTDRDRRHRLAVYRQVLALRRELETIKQEGLHSVTNAVQ